MTVSAGVEKTLLIAIERLNRPLDQVNLHDICNSNENLYGQAGRKERRDVQDYFKNLKRRNARAHMRLLEGHGIPACDGLRARLQRESRIPSPDSTVPSVAETLTSGDDGGFDLNTAFEQTLQISTPPQKPAPPKKISFGGPPSSLPQDSLSTNSHVFSPPQKMSTALPVNPPPATIAGTPERFASPSVVSPPATGFSRGSSAFSGAASSIGSGSMYQHFEGSQFNPKTIHVDLEHPERHERFDIKPNTKKRVHYGIAYETLHCQTAIGCMDFDKWQARTDPMEPNAFYIQGPSRDCHHYNVRNSSSTGTTDINDAHAEADREIGNDPSRNTMFWKFVVPKRMGA